MFVTDLHNTMKGKYATINIFSIGTQPSAQSNIMCTLNHKTGGINQCNI